MPGFAVRNRALFLSDCVGEQSLGFGDDVEQRFVIKPRFSALLGPDHFAVAVEDKGAVVHPLIGFFGVRMKDAPFFGDGVISIRQDREAEAAIFGKAFRRVLGGICADGDDVGIEFAEVVGVTFEGDKLCDAVAAAVAEIEDDYEGAVLTQQAEVLECLAVVGE